MAAYGGEGNLSSIVVKRLGCCDLVLMVLNNKKSIKRWRESSKFRSLNKGRVS